MMLSAALLAGMFYLARRGLDVVDESYLLRMIADPQATRPTGDVYLFGFVLHPLFELVGADIATFRVVGFAVVAAGAALLCREALALVRARGGQVTPAQEWTASLTMAAMSMVVFSFNVTILAYRSVAVLGLMATAAGLARLARHQARTGGALVGLGLWTCFVGKPTSAAAMACVVAAFVVGFRLLTLRMMAAVAVGGGTALAVTLLEARMAPADAIGYLVRGAHQSQLLGGHTGVAMLLGWGQPRLEGLLVFGPMLLVPLVAGLVLRRVEMRARTTVELLATLGVVGAGCIVGAVGASTLGPTGHGWQVLSLGLLLPMIGLTWLVRDRWREARDGIPPEVGLVLVLLVLPYVSAVGSNVSFSVGMPLASVFWALALVMVAITHDERRPGSVFSLVLSLVAALACAMTWVVHHDGLNGGDLGPSLQAAPVEGGQVLLRPEDASAARQLRSASERYGITDQTPVVDLSSVGAGYALMSGGRPIGRAHMYGYLPHSVEAARAALATATCRERAAAWLIYSPDNPLDISPAFTGDSLSLSKDYAPVVAFTSRQGRGTWEMSLLRPLPSVRKKLGC